MQNAFSSKFTSTALVTVYSLAFCQQFDETGVRHYMVDTAVNPGAPASAWLWRYEAIASLMFDWDGHPDSPMNTGEENPDGRFKQIKEINRIGRCTTLSVGDVLRITQPNGDQKILICAPVGWKELTQYQFKAATDFWNHEERPISFWNDVASGRREFPETITAEDFIAQNWGSWS